MVALFPHLLCAMISYFVLVFNQSHLDHIRISLSELFVDEAYIFANHGIKSTDSYVSSLLGLVCVAENSQVEAYKPMPPGKSLEHSGQKYTIHQLTTMLATSKTALFLGHNHRANHWHSVIIKESRYRYWRLAWWLWPGNRTFLEVAILIYQGVHCCTKVCNLCITDWKGSDTTWELRMRSG